MWLDSEAGRKGQEAGSEAGVIFESRLNPSGLTQMEKCVDVIESRTPPLGLFSLNVIRWVVSWADW